MNIIPLYPMTLDDLRTARSESANVAYQTFIKHIRENKSGYFYFIEGKDAPYYTLRVKNRLSHLKIYPIPCWGKSKVLKVYELIKNHDEYLKYKIGYFIDSDFDERLGNNEIYETPTYSVENLYCYPEVFTEVLKNEFALSEVDDNYKKISEHYLKMLSEFIKAQQLFNAWYYCLKERKRNENLQSTGVTLEDTFRKGYITLTVTDVTINYTLEKIRQDYKQAIACEEERIKDVIVYFNSVDNIGVLRGKYLLEFIHRLLILICVDSKNEKLVSDAGLTCHVNLKQIVSSYSQYAITPTCLLDYIDKFS